MNLVASIILILVTIILYISMIRVFSVLFRFTGLTKEKAKFQAISLLTNSGYTTSESEIITNNRSRRKIAVACMITGTIFNVLIVSLLINILVNIKFKEKISFDVLLISFVVFLFIVIVMKIPFMQKLGERIITKIAGKLREKKNLKNIITVLDIYGKNAIVEVQLNVLPSFMKDKTIAESKLKSKYSLNVIIIQRNNRMIAVRADTMMEKHDKIVLFGPVMNIRDLFGSVKADAIIDDSQTNIINLIDNYGTEAVAEVTVNKLPLIFAGKNLVESALKEKYGINVIMIKRDEKMIAVSADTEIYRRDVVILFGPYQNIKNLFLDI